jgi:hypothetical protein
MRISRSQSKMLSSEFPVGDPTSGEYYKFSVPRSRKHQDGISAMFAAMFAEAGTTAAVAEGASFAEALAPATAAEVAAYNAPSFFSAANMQIAGSALSAVSSVASSQQQADAYRLQASQAELQGRQGALNYNRQAFQLFERQQRLAGTIRARAVAGGVDPLTGSPLSVEQSNAYRAGNEMQILSENAGLALSGGLAVSQSLREAANTTENIGLLKGAGMAALGYGTYGTTKLPKTA